MGGGNSQPALDDAANAVERLRAKMRSWQSLLLLLSCGVACACANEAAVAIAQPERLAAFDYFWNYSQAHIYPRELASRFSDSERSKLVTALRSNARLPLAEVLNPFLLSLGVSHTQLYDRRHHSYYMLQSLFGTKDPTSPALYMLGVQLADDGEVEAVLEGFPAARAGVLPGNRILSVDGRPFASLLQWQRDTEHVLAIETSDGHRTLKIRPEYTSLPQSLIRATRASERTFTCEGNSIHYLHLWAGTHPEFLSILRSSVLKAIQSEATGYILDLRDGYGGAWWPHLDPFFADRSDYYSAQVHSAGDQLDSLLAEPESNPQPYVGAMVVLTNRGTRSGKEALAWHFKHSGRAHLIGETTRGAFHAGRGVIANVSDDYMLYLSVAEYRLNGEVIEGHGVVPDQTVKRIGSTDNVLKAAVGHLGCAK